MRWRSSSSRRWRLGSTPRWLARSAGSLEEHPFRERLWGQLMLALYRSGRQAEALEAFGQARGLLAEELGVEPGPGLQRLQAAMLAHDPALASVPVAGGPRGRLPAPVTSLVGRRQALAEAVELVEGHRLVTLVGPPGVGKSRLALEAARAVEPDFAWRGLVCRACPRRWARRRGPGGGAHAGCPRPDAKP